MATATGRVYHERVDEVPSPPAKVAFDRLLSGIFLVITLPVSLAIAAAIAIENAVCPSHRGGVFHSELRVSAGRPFRLYKFRILTPAGEQEIKAGGMPKHVENTPGNLTAVGAVLKQIGLDELPQFFNVIAGRMSLVGPRPKPPAEYKEEIELGHEFRAQVQAGLTGPAQVLKGTVRTGDDSLRADLAYADLLRKGSQLQILAYDAKTLLKTVRVLLRATGE
jgi:lipopolysaccharide/colanic/teichoic acid biosynthesis glycosyltransferase